MEKFLNNLEMLPGRLYNVMHGIPETRMIFLVQTPSPVRRLRRERGGWSAVYARKE